MVTRVYKGDEMNFSIALKELALQNGWTKYKIAKLTGFSQTTVANWLAERTVPYEKDHEAIAQALGTTVEYLFGYSLGKKETPTANGEREEERLSKLFDLCRRLSPDAQTLLITQLSAIVQSRTDQDGQ